MADQSFLFTQYSLKNYLNNGQHLVGSCWVAFYFNISVVCL